MTDQEKSVVLARLCGWEPLSDTIDGITGHGTVLFEDEDGYMLDPEPTLPLNLYDPANMALAWRVHLWTNSVDDPLGNKAKYHLFIAYRAWWDYSVVNCDIWNNKDWQRAWLDKILELATAAGMVTE